MRSEIRSETWSSGRIEALFAFLCFKFVCVSFAVSRSYLKQMKVLEEPTVFTLYCSFVANRPMWTLSTSVVPSGWFAGVFLFSVMVPCPFPSRFFGQSLSCSTGGHCWTMLISRWIRFGLFIV